jgi:hypothetical protein
MEKKHSSQVFPRFTSRVLCIFFMFVSKIAFGQASGDSLIYNRTMGEQTTSGIATGMHIGQYPMLELGYYKHTIFEFPMTVGGAYTIESYFLNDVTFAPKVNYWFNVLGMNVGFNIPWYFDLHGNNSLKIRPELGFGYNHFKINYSVNLSLTNKEMQNIGTHFLSLNYYIPLKTH